MGIETAEMKVGGQTINVDSVPFAEVAGELKQTRPFSSTSAESISGIDIVERITAKAGATITEPGNTSMYYWLLLHG